MAEVDANGEMPTGGSIAAQLPLEVRLRDDATLDNFLARPVMAPLVHALQEQLQPAGEPIVYLYGPAGVGKSHLLQASCHVAGGDSLYLPLQELREYQPRDVLQGVEALDRVCLDDIQSVLGDAAWELALFDFYNRARQRGCRLLLTADAAPRALAVDLPDLRSRLSWGVVFQMVEADDEEKAAILQFRAARRGMSLSDSVARFIVTRAPRDMARLLQVLDHLDQATLAQKRPLSIPFVKQAMGW